MTSSIPPASRLFTVPAMGEVIAGKYEIEHVLGEGGMCVVLAAKHLQLEERFAIKVLRPEFAEDAEGVERFMREGRTAIRIRNDHVVHIHDVDVLPSGAPYLVMEHLEGNDLDALILAHGPSPVALAVDYILQAGEAIAEAHSLGIVHRDLKPANLFLTRRADGSPWIKVLDFGISKMTPREDSTSCKSRLTGRQTVMGSPHYMSPEQLRSTRDVDQRADIWALGTILHELLSGEPAFDGTSLGVVCAKIMEDAPASLSARANVPAGLNAVVLRCLKKKADERFASMGELAVALADFGSPAGRVSAQHIVGILSEGSRPAGGILVRDKETPWGTTDSAWEGLPKPKSHSRLGSLALGALLMAGVVGVVMYLHSTNIVSPSAPVAATTLTNATPEVDAGVTLAAVPSASAAVAAAVTPPIGVPILPVKARPTGAPRAARAPASSASARINPLFDERQ